MSCPALRGCHSQGATVEESLENIKEAIRDWLAVEEQQRAQLKVIETDGVRRGRRGPRHGPVSNISSTRVIDSVLATMVSLSPSRRV